MLKNSLTKAVESFALKATQSPSAKGSTLDI